MTETLNLSDFRVIIVEDDAYMRQLIIRLLRGFGITMIREASSGTEALKYLRTDHYDLMLTDWLMDDMNGLDLIKKIRTEKKPYYRLPIILLTAYSDRKRVTQARDNGVTEVMCKPVSPVKLYERIYSIVNYPRNFVETPNYIGPDRRRHPDDKYEGERKRDGEEAEMPHTHDTSADPDLQRNLKKQQAAFSELSDKISA